MTETFNPFEGMDAETLLNEINLLKEELRQAEENLRSIHSDIEKAQKTLDSLK